MPHAFYAWCPVPLIPGGQECTLEGVMVWLPLSCPSPGVASFTLLEMGGLNSPPAQRRAIKMAHLTGEEVQGQTAGLREA